MRSWYRLYQDLLPIVRSDNKQLNVALKNFRQVEQAHSRGIIFGNWSTVRNENFSPCHPDMVT